MNCSNSILLLPGGGELSYYSSFIELLWFIYQFQYFFCNYSC